MSVLPGFVHHRPSSLEGALSLVSMYDRPPYAGGTELLLAMRSGLFRPEALVDLKLIARLHEIRARDGGVAIGGSVTHQAAVDDPLVDSVAPVLARVLGSVGNPRVRASGTLGGNLCFAEPKSDVATILIALEAEVSLQSEAGTRAMTVAEFMVGPYATAKDENELLVEIVVPGRDGRAAVYDKFQTMERPTIGVAAALLADGRCRLVVGAVGGGPEVFEADTPAHIEPDDVAGAIDVIPDLTGSDRYKRHLTSVYVRRVLRALEGGV